MLLSLWLERHLFKVNMIDKKFFFIFLGKKKSLILIFSDSLLDFLIGCQCGFSKVYVDYINNKKYQDG
jgi:hypothetical protein